MLCYLPSFETADKTKKKTKKNKKRKIEGGASTSEKKRERTIATAVYRVSLKIFLRRREKLTEDGAKTIGVVLGAVVSF